MSLDMLQPLSILVSAQSAPEQGSATGSGQVFADRLLPLLRTQAAAVPGTAPAPFPEGEAPVPQSAGLPVATGASLAATIVPPPDLPLQAIVAQSLAYQATAPGIEVSTFASSDVIRLDVGTACGSPRGKAKPGQAASPTSQHDVMPQALPNGSLPDQAVLLTVVSAPDPQPQQLISSTVGNITPDAPVPADSAPEVAQAAVPEGALSAKHSAVSVSRQRIEPESVDTAEAPQFLGVSDAVIPQLARLTEPHIPLAPVPNVGNPTTPIKSSVDVADITASPGRFPPARQASTITGENNSAEGDTGETTSAPLSTRPPQARTGTSTVDRAMHMPAPTGPAQVVGNNNRRNSALKETGPAPGHRPDEPSDISIEAVGRPGAEKTMVPAETISTALPTEPVPGAAFTSAAPPNNAVSPHAAPASLSPPSPLAAVTVPSPAGPGVVRQIEANVRFLGRTQEGRHEITLRLDPVELGHLQISIVRERSGPASVTLTVERPDTLLLLLRDQTQLHHALTSAGVPQDGRSVNFQLAPVPANPPSDNLPSTVTTFAGGQLGGFLGGSSQQGSSRENESRSTAPSFWLEGNTSADAGAPQVNPARKPQRAGVDITA